MALEECQRQGESMIYRAQPGEVMGQTLIVKTRKLVPEDSYILFLCSVMSILFIVFLSSFFLFVFFIFKHSDH